MAKPLLDHEDVDVGLDHAGGAGVTAGVEDKVGLTALFETPLQVDAASTSPVPLRSLQGIKPGIIISQGIGDVEPLSKPQKAPERQPAHLIRTEGSNYVGVVPRGGGLVHWLYHGDEEEGEEA